MSTAWTCPDCGAPFGNSNASHSCVRIELDARFAGAAPDVRAAYGSGLFLHRVSIRSPDELDDAFARFVREAAARVGRRERLSTARRGGR